LISKSDSVCKSFPLRRKQLLEQHQVAVDIGPSGLVSGGPQFLAQASLDEVCGKFGTG
jgi:hypothetical protein